MVEDDETMSDHAYIAFCYKNRSEGDWHQERYPRWNKEDFDASMFNTVVSI